MSDVEMDVVARKKKRPVCRWMPGERRRRLAGQARQGLLIAGQAGGAFLMCFADVMGIPSGMQAAWLAALSAAGESLLWPLSGCLMAFMMRLIWGLPLRLETLPACLAMLLGPRLLFGHGGFRMLIMTGLSLLPCVMVSALTGTAADLLLSCATVAVSALSAPVFFRGLQAVRSGRAVSSLEERVAVGYLAAMMLCGGGRMVLFGMNVGLIGAGWITLSMAMALGVSAGCVTGIIGGLTLALQGLPVSLSVALAMGGFLAGMAQVREKRLLTCGCFLMGTVMTLLLSGTSAMGCVPATAATALAAAFLPGAWTDEMTAFFQRFRQADRSGGDAYAADALNRWERTVDAMARAVPSPMMADEERTGMWWRTRLCEGCPDQETCLAMASPVGISRAQSVWNSRTLPQEQWQESLEGLRGLGCARLYHLRERMNALCEEDKRDSVLIQKACYQRDMLTTHLAAMAGAARRFAVLSSGGTWWDDATSRSLRQAAAEIAFPATLLYARRIQGHAQIAWEISHSVPGSNLPAELCRLTADTLETPMRIACAEDDRITLTECPPFEVEQGVATASLIPGDGQNGDTVCLCTLCDGRFLAALSDGMGHGAQAGESSRKTAELLRLCLDAGYSRTQTLTAVNGMMLSATRGERFATVDLLTIDLWTGGAALDKLGAAPGWLLRGDEMTMLDGDALPLGILEQVESRSSVLKLRDGDQLVLLSDGIGDALGSEEKLREAVGAALKEGSASSAAAALLQAAAAAQAEGRQDDQTVVVLRIARQNPRREAVRRRSKPKEA